MNLAAKASRGFSRRDRRATAGYAMAALLIAMAIMALMLTAAMPTWSHMIRREKEEELIFRGNQYARAINQYQRKFANASPASLDVLIEQHMLRKKFRDPMAIDKEGQFQLLYLSSGMGARAGQPPGGPTRGGTTGRGSAGTTQPGTGTSYSTTPSGGIVGVASKNTGQSIKSYKQKQHYNEWQFIGMEQSLQAGGGAGGAAGPQRGGRGGREGGGRESRPDNRGGFGPGGFGGRGGGPDRGGPPARGRGF